MAHETITFEQAQATAKSFAKGNLFGTNAARIKDNEKVNANVEAFSTVQNEAGDSLLYCVATSAKHGSLRFRVKDAEIQLPSLPIGATVVLERGSMPMVDRETKEPMLNADGSPRLNYFVTYVQTASLNTAAAKTIAQSVQTDAIVK